jgi:hypothetical protein
VASPHDALEVDEVLRGIRRAWKQPPRQKTPAIDADVQRLADAVEPQTRQGLRDRALVLWILPVRCAARSSWPSTWST